MKHRRTIKLILPGLQLKLIVAFLFLSSLAMLLQYILLLNVFAKVASELPNDGLVLLDGLAGMLGYIFAITAFLLLPLTFVVGLLATHRFAGPVYRFQVFLRQVIAGEKPSDCKLRKGDELQELCELINQATAGERAKPVAREESKAADQGLRAAG